MKDTIRTTEAAFFAYSKYFVQLAFQEEVGMLARPMPPLGLRPTRLDSGGTNDSHHARCPEPA